MNKHHSDRRTEVADTLRRIAKLHPGVLSVSPMSTHQPLNPEYVQIAQASDTTPEEHEPMSENTEPFFLRLFTIPWSKVFR